MHKDYNHCMVIVSYITVSGSDATRTSTMSSNQRFSVSTISQRLSSFSDDNKTHQRSTSFRFSSSFTDDDKASPGFSSIIEDDKAALIF